jgi:hypothetical protein
MYEMEMFKYPLYAADANFTKVELQNRVDETVDEISILLKEIGYSNSFEFVSKFSTNDNYFWLVLFARPTAQMQLQLSSNPETTVEFVRRVHDKINDLPLIVNLIALDLEAQLTMGHERLAVTNEDKNLMSLMFRNRGKKRLFRIGDRDQNILFPELRNIKMDPNPRHISCKVKSLSKYEAVVDSIEDPHFLVKKSQKIPLVFGSALNGKETFLKLAECLYAEARLIIEVNALINIMTETVVEYQLQRPVIKNIV